MKRIIDELRDLPPSERQLVVHELAALDAGDPGEVLDAETWKARWTEAVVARKENAEAGRSRMYSAEEARQLLAERRALR